MNATKTNMPLPSENAGAESDPTPKPMPAEKMVKRGGVRGKPRAPTKEIQHEEMSALLDYDPISGELRWKVYRNWKVPAGSIAGTQHKEGGYLVIKVDGVLYKAHRIAWAIFHKENPPPEIDHENLIKNDNSIKNLRTSDRAGNITNTRVRKDSRSGVKGVKWHRQGGKWVARIRSNGKRVTLGYFTNIQDAEKSYAEASKRLHGDYGRTSARPDAL